MQRGWGPSGCFSGQTGFQQPRPTVPPGYPLTLCFLLPSHPVAQGLLGIQDLGQVFFEPIKDKQGNILIVTLKEVKTNQTFESVRWVPICKLQSSRKSVSSPEEPTALDTLLISLQVCVGAGGAAIAVGSPGNHSLLPFSLERSQQKGGTAKPASKNSLVSREGIRLVPDSPWQHRVFSLCHSPSPAGLGVPRHQHEPCWEDLLSPAVPLSPGKADLPPEEQPRPLPGPLPGLFEAVQCRGSDPSAGARAAPQHPVPRQDSLQPQHLQVGFAGLLCPIQANTIITSCPSSSAIFPLIPAMQCSQAHGGIVGVSCVGSGLNSAILVGAIQLSIFCDSDSAWSKPSSLSTSTSLPRLWGCCAVWDRNSQANTALREAESTSTRAARPFTCLSLTFCREEWEWLQKMASVEEPVPTEPEADRSQNPLFQELQVAIKELMTLVNIPLQEVETGAKVWGGGRAVSTGLVAAAGRELHAQPFLWHWSSQILVLCKQKVSAGSACPGTVPTGAVGPSHTKPPKKQW